MMRSLIVTSIVVLLTSTALAADPVRYAYTINLAQREWQDHNLSRMKELLESCDVADRGWEWQYLYNQLKPERTLIRGINTHTIAYSPDSKKIATIGLKYSTPYDPKITPSTSIVIRDVITGKELQSIPIAKDRYSHLEGIWFNSTCTHLMTKDYSTFEVWDIEAKKRTNTVEHVQFARFAKDGKSIEYSRDKELKKLAIGEKETGSITIQGRGESYLGTWIVPNSDRCVDAVDGQEMRILDVSTGKELLSLENSKTGFRNSVWTRSRSSKNTLIHQFDGNGKTIAAVSTTGAISFWNISTGKLIRTLPASGKATELFALRPDGEQFVSAFEKSAVRRKSSDGTILATYKFDFKIETVAYSPDGKQIAFLLGGDSTIRIFDAEAIPGYRSFGTDGNHLEITSDGKFVSTSSGSGDTVVMDFETGTQLASVRGFSGAISPHGKRIAATRYPLMDERTPNDRNMADLWDAGGKHITTLKGHSDAIWAMAFSPDSKELITGANDNKAIIWDASTGDKLAEIADAFAKQPNSIAWNSTGQKIALAAFTGQVRIFDRQKLKDPLILTDACGTVAFHPDGNRLAVMNSIEGPHRGPRSDFNTIRIVDVTTGKDVIRLKGHSQMVRAIAFHPDGKRLASVSDDRTLRIWDTENALELMRWSYPGQYDAPSVKFHPDGKQLLVGVYKNIIILDATPPKEEPKQ